MLTLTNLQVNKKAVKERKRVGRGNSSGHGTYSGRGIKGQNSRSGSRKGPRFEGGRTPLYRQLPKRRGFLSFKAKSAIVNLQLLEQNYQPNEQVTPKNLQQKGLIADYRLGVKILGQGRLTKKLQVIVNGVSQSAGEAIKKAGGTLKLINSSSVVSRQNASKAKTDKNK